MLFTTALDLVTAPTSKALVKRILSLREELTRGKRNRMPKTLEQNVFLKLNNNLMTHAGLILMS